MAFIYLFKPPYAIASVPSLMGHAIAYRWRSLPRVRRPRASKPQGTSKRMLPWQVTMDKLICASLSHIHYWYEVGMLKVPAVSSYIFKNMCTVFLDDLRAFFRHQRRLMDNCSPGRAGVAQNVGTRSGTFHGEMDRYRESQGWTTACSRMPERSLCPFTPENLVLRDGFGSPVPRQPAHLHTQAESGAYLRDSSRVPR